jgi:hypothetical protein
MPSAPPVVCTQRIASITGSASGIATMIAVSTG